MEELSKDTGRIEPELVATNLIGINQNNKTKNSTIMTPHYKSVIEDHVAFVEMEKQVQGIGAVGGSDRNTRQLATFKGIAMQLKSRHANENDDSNNTNDKENADGETSDSSANFDARESKFQCNRRAKSKNKAIVIGDKSESEQKQCFKSANSIESIDDSSYSSNDDGTTNSKHSSNTNTAAGDVSLASNCDINNTKSPLVVMSDKLRPDKVSEAEEEKESVDEARQLKGDKFNVNTMTDEGTIIQLQSQQQTLQQPQPAQLQSSGKGQLKSSNSLVRFDNFDHRNDGQATEMEQEQQQSSMSGGGANQGNRTRPQNQPPFMFAGICASILSSFFFSLSILCIKLLPNSNTIQEKTMACSFRGLWFMIVCSLCAYFQGTPLTVKRDEVWVNILRAVFGYFAVLFSYFGLSYISMGDSIALVFSSPVWTSILSYFILKEPLQWIQLVALPASFVGIILIANPALILPDEFMPGSTNGPLPPVNATTEGHHLLHLHTPLPTPSVSDFEQRWPGIAISLAASFLVSAVYIVLKFRKSTPIQTTTFWFGTFTFFASLAIMLGIGFGHIPDTWEEWVLVIGNGSFSWLGQSVLQWAFFYEDASVLSVVRTLDVALSFVLSSIFLDDEIYWTSIVGATIISLVVVSIMLNNWITSAFCRSPSSTSSLSSSSSPTLPYSLSSSTSSSVLSEKQEKVYPNGPKRTGSDTSVTSITISERIEHSPEPQIIPSEANNLTQRKAAKEFEVLRQ